MSKEKQSHAQDSIYIVQQFSLCPQSCRDFTIIKENYNVRLQCFSFSKIITRQNPNHKKNGFYILRTGFTMGYKNGPKIFCRPKPSLHGLSLSKSPIIWVINRIKLYLTTIFHGIKFINYHLYSEIPCNFLFYINYHIICQKLILHSIAKSYF